MTVLGWNRPAAQCSPADGRCEEAAMQPVNTSGRRYWLPSAVFIRQAFTAWNLGPVHPYSIARRCHCWQRAR
jgi:hypothetical protein